jgi:hypothetical protein
MFVIPATEEVEVGTSWSKAGPGNRVKPYLKNKLKGLAEWLKWPSNCKSLSSIFSTTRKTKTNK